MFQSTGFYLMHQVQLGFVRHEMKQRIKAGVPEEDLVLLKIAKSEELNPEIFEREHSREFRYKGEMYDVMRLEEKGDTTYYSCIHDVKESGLFRALDRMVENELNENKSHKHQREMMLGFFQKVYLNNTIGQINTNTKAKAEAVFAYADPKSEEHALDQDEPPQFMFFA